MSHRESCTFSCAYGLFADDRFAGIEKKALKLGDYSVAGLEDLCVVERKDLPDLVHSFTVERPVFVHRLRQMARYPHRLLVITASLIFLCPLEI